VLLIFPYFFPTCTLGLNILMRSLSLYYSGSLNSTNYWCINSTTSCDTSMSTFSCAVFLGLWLVKNLQTIFLVNINWWCSMYSYNWSRLIMALYFYSSSRNILLMLCVTRPRSRPYSMLTRNAVIVSGKEVGGSVNDFKYKLRSTMFFKSFFLVNASFNGLIIELLFDSFAGLLIKTSSTDCFLVNKDPADFGLDNFLRSILS